MHEISASIVVYKSNQAMLAQAINSYLMATSAGTLYIIDNSPTDVARKLTRHDRIEYTFNQKNVGFGAGHNIALRKVLGTHVKYHIVLNPDVYFAPNVLRRLFDFMEAHPETGLTMPKVLYPDGQLQNLCKLLPTPSTLIYRRFLFFMRKCAAKRNYLYELQFTGYNKVMDVPFLSGCFMFLRTKALEEIGLFDERIFLYTEDIDLSRRIHKRFRTVFIPDVMIYHYHQRGSYKDLKLLLHNIRSAIKYFNKWGWIIDHERERVNQTALVRISNELG